MRYATKEDLLRKASFRCPVGINPSNCDGHPCPHRNDDLFDDYYNECIDSLYAKLLLNYEESGKRINPEYGWLKREF